MILITGHSGTIGSALVEKLKDRSIIGFSRSPSRIDIEIPYFMGDVSNLSDLSALFAANNIEQVIHVAANKFIDHCEMHPSQAVRNNIDGIVNLLKVCSSHDVKKIVVVTSDKACNTSHVYGMTKALTERLCTEACDYMKATINCVRFGNVLGSNGSVLAIWKRQVDAGFPIKIRCRDGRFPTRFMMSSSEAASLCIDVLDGNFSNGSIITKPMLSLDNLKLASAAFPLYDQEIVSMLEEESLSEKLINSTEEKYNIAKKSVQHIEISPKNKTIVVPKNTPDGWYDSDTAKRYDDKELSELLKKVRE